MLDQLDWESFPIGIVGQVWYLIVSIPDLCTLTYLEARHAKTQVTMLFKIIHGLVDIPAEDYLVPASTRTRSQHSLKFLQIPVSSNYYKFRFFPRTFVVGIFYQAMWLRLPVWYPSNRSYQVCQSKLSVPAMQVHSCDTLRLCCRGLCVPWYPQGRQFG